MRPAHLSPVAASQTGVVGTLLDIPLRVRVSNARGDPLRGVRVAWTPASGTVSATTSQTDAAGIAETRWTLGTVAGLQQLQASIAGRSSVAPLQLSATAMPGPTTGIVISPQDITLQPLEQVSLVATVEPDQYGNEVTADVVWSSSDQISASVATDGRVTAGRAGRSIVKASVGSVSAEREVEVAAIWKAIGVGRVHSCALDALGYAFCWGENGAHQLGVSGIAFDSIPRAVSGNRRFDSLTVGWDHACGLTSDHVAYCWGHNTSGQLGIGTLAIGSTATPTIVAGGHTFASISSNGVHTCGIRMTGEAYCWGWEGEGELGNGASLTFTGQPAPVAVLGGRTYASISGGSSHTCAVTSAGTPYCWGNSFSGQVGDGAGTGYRTSPVLVANGLTVTRVVAGGAHSCALEHGGRMWCWGENDVGQIGDGSFQTRIAPEEVDAPAPFTLMSAGQRHTCALDGAGRAYCWGFNATGQLGDGTTLRKGSPVVVATDVRFVALSGGSGHTCALTGTGQVYCWGDNHIGQLGIGTFAQRTSPVVVAPP